MADAAHPNGNGGRLERAAENAGLKLVARLGMVLLPAMILVSGPRACAIIDKMQNDIGDVAKGFAAERERVNGVVKIVDGHERRIERLEFGGRP